ncbi:hypothetical protein ACVNF4_13630 [Streptomyces sp. S6]
MSALVSMVSMSADESRTPYVEYGQVLLGPSRPPSVGRHHQRNRGMPVPRPVSIPVGDLSSAVLSWST